MTGGRTALFAMLAGVLICTGCATLVLSQGLTFRLIAAVGEERALGAKNVVRNADGSVLLTNPGAMMLWTTPIWTLGFVQIAGAAAFGRLAKARTVQRRVAGAPPER